MLVNFSAVLTEASRKGDIDHIEIIAQRIITIYYHVRGEDKKYTRRVPKLKFDLPLINEEPNIIYRNEQLYISLITE